MTTPKSGRRGGDPPRDTRYRKGQSGNPAGRPKGSKNYTTLAKRMLNKIVSGNVGGKAKKMTLLEATLFKVGQGALTGEKQALATVLKMAVELDKAFAEANVSSGQSAEFEVPDDAALLRMAARLAKRAKKE